MSWEQLILKKQPFHNKANKAFRGSIWKFLKLLKYPLEVYGEILLDRKSTFIYHIIFILILKAYSNHFYLNYLYLILIHFLFLLKYFKIRSYCTVKIFFILIHYIGNKSCKFLFLLERLNRTDCISWNFVLLPPFICAEICIE